MRNADISRLPAIWDQGEYSETVCEYLKRAFNLDAPTRGEWGYTTEDAVILNVHQVLYLLITLHGNGSLWKNVFTVNA